ncbi:MAG TPA: hypothetical protein PLS65_13700, partial [Ferruginibacter sp.]|nr:hypothetical protein [Ferruginibacter sp.]
MIKIYSILKFYLVFLAILFFSLLSFSLLAQETRQLSVDKPQAVADLRTTGGAALVDAKWFVQEAHVKEIAFKAPGPGTNGDSMPLYPTGPAIKTHIIHPQLGAADFDKGFRPLQPTELEMRQGTGLLSYVWYKVEITIPARIGKLNTAGTTAVFEITVDDYSEIWVNGKQMQGFGQSGNGLVAGYNTRNRVILTNNARAGERFSIAVLGING